jgi:glutamine amidotransferase
VLVVVDYGMGNLGAIPNMLKRLGAQALITADPAAIRDADRVILPGVGAFDTAVRNIDGLGLRDVLAAKAFEDRVPFLGLCLGMHLLMSGSEEGALPGLGWISGRVVRFRTIENADLRVPHMGWNEVADNGQSVLLRDFDTAPRFYFAHSFHLDCDDPADVAGRTMYGYSFPSVVERSNIFGVQFHPEKSHRFGLKLLANFLAA